MVFPSRQSTVSPHLMASTGSGIFKWNDVYQNQCYPRLMDVNKSSVPMVSHQRWNETTLSKDLLHKGGCCGRLVFGLSSNTLLGAVLASCHVILERRMVQHSWPAASGRSATDNGSWPASGMSKQGQSSYLISCLNQADRSKGGTWNFSELELKN